MATGLHELHRDQISDVRDTLRGARPVLREVIPAERRFDGIIGRRAAPTSVVTTRTGLEAYPLTRAEERGSMQLVTMAECFTFFFSIAVILYVWIQ
jgi:hypothetical protein